MSYRDIKVAWPRYAVDGNGTPGGPAKFATIPLDAVRAFEAVAVAIGPDAADTALAAYYEINGS